MTNFIKSTYFTLLGKGIALSVISYLGANYAVKRLINSTVSNTAHRLLTDKYDENVWDLVSSSRRIGLQNIVETNLRAEEGKTIKRPLGSPKKMINFSELMFDIAQLHTYPTPNTAAVNTHTTIGPRAKKPMTVDIPILVSGMAAGLALSEKAKVAIAKGTAKAGTAAHTGEGAFLEQERKTANKLILHYNRGSWNKTSDVIKQSDMIEIQFGQGAIAGLEHSTPNKDLKKKFKNQMKLKPKQDAVINARMPGVASQRDLTELVKKLRKITGGVPIGVKLGAGKNLEKDMEKAVTAGVDYLALDGAEAASYLSPPILQDDFGLPTLLTVSRASKFLADNKLKGKVSLIISGGLFTPGDYLKTLALGADAVYIGTTAIFALSHLQNLKAIPFEPPGQVIWETGQFKGKFNVNKGAKNIEKFLKASACELKVGVRALGKTDIHDVNQHDMYTTNPQISDITGVQLG